MNKNTITYRLFFVALILANLLFTFRVADTVNAQVVAQDNATQESAQSSQSQQEIVNTDSTNSQPVLPNSYDSIDRSSFVGTRTFIISAYYSPLVGQNKYSTGSYNGDIRLNGGGVHGADGSNVYPGMIAAPKGYPFGTKMNIPGIGTVAVHDRGGAIVHSGQRGNNFDRLDVWMGYGDAGLQRALNWGKRTIDVYVYGVNESVKENVVLAGYSDNEKYAQASSNNVSDTVMITASKTLSLGDSGEEVSKIQAVLKNLNYYSGKVNSIFDEATLAAVTKFQIDHNIVKTSADFGAGHVGPKTAGILAASAATDNVSSSQVSLGKADTFTSDLNPGDTGAEVRKLQEELAKINFLGIDPTGLYGDVTTHAVYKFQQSQGLVGDMNSVGAGVFGPKTRAVLNSIIAQRVQTESMIANKKPEEN